MSDFIVCINGRFVAIELKAKRGKPSPHQLEFIEEVRRAGGIGGVCYSLKDVKDLLRSAVEYQRHS